MTMSPPSRGCDFVVTVTLIMLNKETVSTVKVTLVILNLQTLKVRSTLCCSSCWPLWPLAILHACLFTVKFRAAGMGTQYL